MNDEKFITPSYETISAQEERKIKELVNSSLLHAFSMEDYKALVKIFIGVIGRLGEGEHD